MSYLNELNEIQRNAVTTTEGPVLVVAGPGSGKTRVLTYRIAYLIEQGVQPYNILALTFTNKAAKEMKARIETVVGSKANQLWAGTFHSIFARILRSEAEKIGFPSNFTIYDSQDSKSLIKTIVKDFGLDPKKYTDNVILNRISSSKSNLISPKMYENDNVIRQEDATKGFKEIYRIYQAYAMRCKRAGAMDFDDLLYQLYVLLHKNPDNILDKYRERFKYVMVDEFQDTNFLQYSIVNKLVRYDKSPNNVCVVGDDAQSIYAFRGATIENILNFERDFPKLQTFKLVQNYRSTTHIVEAANELITFNKNQIQKTIKSERGDGEKIKINKYLTDTEEASKTVDAILSQKSAHDFENKDFAILYRTNAQSRVFEEFLRRYNVPYKIYGGMSFYQRKEVKDLVAYLRATVNPKDDEAIRRIINYPKRGIGNTTVTKLSQAATEHNASLWDAICNVEKLGFTKRTSGLIIEFRTLLAELIEKNKTEVPDAYDIGFYIAQKSTILRELKADSTVEGKSRFENVSALLDGIKEFVENDELIDEATLPDKTLTSYLQNIALVSDLDTDNDDDNKVGLMSIHASKGLEFKSIFVVGMEENLFPSFMSRETPDGLDEERRLFYVAITRAEQMLAISCAGSRYQFGQMKHNEPSRFLAEISAQNVDSSTPLIPRSGVSGLSRSSIKRPFNKTSSIDKAKIDNFEASPTHMLKEGLSILHLRFGEGTITAIEGGAANKVATVQFKDAGEKRIMLKFAKLQIIDK